MISLSDEQLAELMRLCGPLQPSERAAYLEAVAERLRAEPVIGDGSVHRVCVEVLQARRFWQPPAFTRKMHARRAPR